MTNIKINLLENEINPRYI